MIDILRRRVDDALAAGFAGLRVTVEMTELLATMDDPRQCQSYQVAVNSIVPRSQSSCIFLYDRSRLSPSRLRAVLHAHPLVVLENCLYPNIYHEPPEAALDESSQIHHLNAMIDQIRRLATPGASASTEKLVADRGVLSHLLAAVPIFEDLPRDVIDHLVETAPLRRYRRGQFIFLEGEPIATIHVLVEGHVKMIRETEDGREVILHLVGPGEVFGIAGFGGEQVQRFSAQASEDAAVIDIPTVEFIRLLSASPRCLQATFQTIGMLLRDIESRICDLQTKGAESRLAGVLVRLAAGSPEALSRQPRTSLALTRQDLADLAGTNLSTASRAVNAWARAGLISLGRARIAVLDERASREIAQGIRPFEHVGMSAEKACPRPTSLLRR